MMRPVGEGETHLCGRDGTTSRACARQQARIFIIRTSLTRLISSRSAASKLATTALPRKKAGGGAIASTSVRGFQDSATAPFFPE